MHSLRHLVLVTCAISAMSLSPIVLHAQFPANVQVGTRVRLWLPEAERQADGPARRQLLRGSIESVAPDTLLISIPGSVGTVAIPRASLRRLEVSRGVSRPASAAARAVNGAIGGASLWALMNDPSRSDGPNYRTDWHAAGVGAAWGAGIGAVIGFVIPHERWSRVRLSR